MITIGIPCYNSEQFIDDAIRSAVTIDRSLIQEILVIDNCSTDNTELVARAWAHRDRRIVVYRNERNIGSRGNLQLVTERATAPLLKYLCADDILLPGTVEQQYRALQSKGVRLVTCDMIVVDRNLRNPIRHSLFSGRQVALDLVASSLERRQNLVGGPTNFLLVNDLHRMRRAWDSSYKYISDIMFVGNVMGMGDRVYNIGVPGYLYRRHEASDTALECSNAAMVKAEWSRALAEFSARPKHASCGINRASLLYFKLRRWALRNRLPRRGVSDESW